VILLCVLALAPVLSANDDGEILEASIILTVSPDFKVKEEVSVTKRLLSYQALDTDGDPRTPYCADLQTLTFTRARVTTPAGKVVDCTPNAFNLSTPHALVAHPVLSGWQEMVVTFLGLEPGAQTELSYIREDKTAFRTTFEKKQVLAWHFPIRKGTVVVRLPKELALTYQIMNFKGEAAASPKGDTMEYTFTFTDIPAFSGRDMHNSAAFLPTLYLTTTPSWKVAGKNLAALADKYGSPDEAITKKAKELTKDATTDLDKAIAFHKFVKERFAEVEWPLQDSLLLFNDAGKTFQMGQGTNLELALLLRALFKAADLKAMMALSGPLPAPHEAPGMMAFDKAFVFSESVQFDPSKSIRMGTDEIAILWETGNFQQGMIMLAVTLRGEIEIGKGTISGSAIVSLSGSLNPYAKNLEEEGVLEDAVKPFMPLPGLKIESIKPTELGYGIARLEVKFTGKVKEGEQIIRLLPESKAFLPGIEPRTVTSALPIQLPNASISICWTVKGLGKAVEPTWKSEGKWGSMAIERSLDGEALKMDAMVKAKNGPLAPADYPALQSALAAWQNPVVAGVLLP